MARQTRPSGVKGFEVHCEVSFNWGIGPVHCAAKAAWLSTRALVAVVPRRAPVTDVGIKTAFRHDQGGKHFQKSKHLLTSEVS